MSLTPSQQSAVDHDKNLILFAGPGSGKTSTSVAKGVSILQTPENRLCMITFTSAAAGEMRERMQHSLEKQGFPSPGERFICGTFHAITKNHYFKHARDRKNILMPNAQNGMINAMLARIERVERKGYTEALGKYQSALDPSKVEIEKPEHVQFIQLYLQRLRSSNSIDLAMAMRECTILIGNESIPPLPITHLIGDEMQDADEVQLDLILHHARKGVKCTLVADDDQTIYGWRSALGYEGLMTFGRETRCKTIRLEENFRSREEVVAHASRLIAFNNPNRVEKNQRATRGPGGYLGQCGFSGLDEQCQVVAHYALDVRQQGESMAVLARDNITLQTMGASLNALGISYEMDGETLWDKPEVSTYLSTLQSLITRQTAQLQPLISTWPLEINVRNSFERALGQSAADFMKGNVPEVDNAGAVEAEFLQAAAGHFKRWRKQMRSGEYLILLDDVTHVVTNWYVSHVSSETPAARSAGKRCRDNISTAADILRKMQSKSQGTIAGVLHAVSRFKSSEKDRNNVQLMTVHKSKGLEFDTVFHIGASKPDDKVFEVEAERRLFFVAVTRAKERFFAFYSNDKLTFINEARIPGILLTAPNGDEDDENPWAEYMEKYTPHLLTPEAGELNGFALPVSE